MKFRKVFGFHLLICLSAFVLEVEAQYKKKVRVDDYSYSYEYDHDYSAGDSKPKPVDRRIPCYACSYQEIAGHPHGMINCNEPFNSFQVPEAICNGSCAMTHIWMKKPTDFLIFRDCRPICEEIVSETQYTRCCSTKLCNSFTSSVQQVNFSLCLTVLLPVIALVGFQLVL